VLTVAIDEPAPRVLGVRLGGELDPSSESGFANVLVPAGRVAGLLVLDLTPRWILGSHGVAALVGLHHPAGAGPPALRLVDCVGSAAAQLALTAHRGLRGDPRTPLPAVGQAVP
jgi:hypothetical protein